MFNTMYVTLHYGSILDISKRVLLLIIATRILSASLTRPEAHLVQGPSLFILATNISNSTWKTINTEFIS